MVKKFLWKKFLLIVHSPLVRLYMIWNISILQFILAVISISRARVTDYLAVCQQEEGIKQQQKNPTKHKQTKKDKNQASKQKLNPTKKIPKEHREKKEEKIHCNLHFIRFLSKLPSSSSLGHFFERLSFG